MRSLLAMCLAFALAGSVCPAAVVAGWQDAEIHLQRGVELLASMRVAEAIEQLETALLQRPQDVRIRYHLGRALLTAGRAEEAVEHLQVALEVAPEPGPVHFLLGQVYLETGDFTAAKAALDVAAASRPDFLQIDFYPSRPDFLQIDFYRAELCYRVGQVSIARERFEALAEAVPEWEAALVRAGTLALEQGDAAEAIGSLQAALEISPESPLLWLRLGTALVDDDQADEALAAYRKAVELAPSFPAALHAVAIQLMNLDVHEQAMEALDAVLANDPDDGLIRYHRATLLSRAGQHAEALTEIDAAIEDLRVPGEASAQSAQDVDSLATAIYLRADLLMKLDRRVEAVEVLRDLVVNEPDYPEALFLLGNALARGGERAAGMELLERFKTLSDVREHRQLGDQFRRLEKDPVRARAAFEAALEILPDDPRSLLGLGAVQRETGEIQQSLETLARARAAGAGDLDWHREWVLALHLAGRQEEARQAWEDARGEGFTLGPEVWAVMYDGAALCK